MRILLIDHAPFFGGAESFLLDLFARLDRENFSPTIVTDGDSPTLVRLRASTAHVLTMRLPRLNHKLLFTPRLLVAGARLARLARGARADLMHTSGVRTHLVGAVAAKLSGIPLVWRICDDTFPPRLAQAFARSARVIVAASRWLARKYPQLRFDGLVQDGARAPTTISRREARARLGLKEDDRVVAHVARLVRWKGQEVFIRAFARATRQVPQTRGLIVGDWVAGDDRGGILAGGEKYAQELRALAKDLVPSRIHFTGFMADPGIAYAASDIFVHSSILPEPFGRTVIEAMMTGVPVIATDAGALPEIVTSDSGVLTPLGDSDALADALVALLHDRGRREELGRGARARAVSEFSVERMARRMENYYRLALDKPRSNERKSTLD